MGRDRVVIFGLRDTAELAHYYLSRDTDWDVVAFTASEEWVDCDVFRGKPVITFEEIEKTHPPEKVKLFAPMTGSDMNRNRERIFGEGKERGYEFISYVSPAATICDNVIGENCFILEDNTIQPFTEIGDNVVMWSGNHIGHHSVIRDNAFVASHCVISGHCEIGENCFLGVNSAVREYSSLGKGTLLAMGAVLSQRNTEEWSVYQGNPAKRRGKVPSYRVL